MPLPRKSNAVDEARPEVSFTGFDHKSESWLPFTLSTPKFWHADALRSAMPSPSKSWTAAGLLQQLGEFASLKGLYGPTLI